MRHRAPALDEASITELRVEGELPHELSGHYLFLGPGPIGAGPSGRPGPGTRVHAIGLHAGEPTSFSSRWIRTDGTAAGPAATDRSTGNLIEFGGRILALDEGAVAQELAPDLRSRRAVDLAGHAEGIGAHPTLDPSTGELHLLGSPRLPSASHHVISPGALTRRTRPLTDAPTPIHHLTVTRDRLVLFGQGLTGVTSRIRSDNERIDWFSTDTAAGENVVAAHDEGSSVIVHIAGDTLERWTLEPACGIARRELVDATPQRFGRINDQVTTAPVQFLYAIGGGGAPPFAGTRVSKHDLVAGRQTTQDFGRHRHPGGLVFVSDPRRAPEEDGGWLLGLIHDGSTGRASLVVLDAAACGIPRVATIPIPRRVSYGHRGTWSSSKAPD